MSYEVKTTIPQNENIDADALKSLEDNKKLFLINRELTGGNLLKELGMNITEPGEEVPESGGQPRIFLLKEGKVSSLKENGMKVGSADFWKAAAKGQVFAYPDGGKHPVQIQLRKPDDYIPRVEISAPLDPARMPEPEMFRNPPRRPRWYHRIFRWGNNRKICQTYDSFMAEKNREAAAMKVCAVAIQQACGHKRTDDVLAEEKKEAAVLRADLKEIQSLKRAKVDLKEVRDQAAAVRTGVANAVSIYRPTPEIRPEWIKQDPKNPNPEHTGKVYTQKAFDELKPIDLKGAQVKGQAVTDEEFAALAVFAALDEELAIRAQNVAGDAEAAVDAFGKAGYSRKEAGMIISGSVQESYGRSVMYKTPRSDSGDYFKDGVQPAREKALEALEAYQAGNKAPMAKILARMVWEEGKNAVSNQNLGGTVYAQNRMAGQLLDMMERDPERDPELNALVRQEYEQREREFHERHPNFPKAPGFDEQVRRIRQLQKMEELREKSLVAKQTLLDARVNGTEQEISAEEKRRLTKDILKYNIVSHRYLTDYSLATNSKKPNPRNADSLAFRKHADGLSKTPGPETGSKTGGTSVPLSPTAIMTTSMLGRTVPKSEIMDQVMDPRKMEELDEGLDRLIEKEGLDKAGVRELVEMVASPQQSGGEYTQDKLAAKFLAANPQPGRPAPGQELRPHPVQAGEREQEGPAAEEQQIL